MNLPAVRTARILLAPIARAKFLLIVAGQFSRCPNLLIRFSTDPPSFTIVAGCFQFAYAAGSCAEAVTNQLNRASAGASKIWTTPTSYSSRSSRCAAPVSGRFVSTISSFLSSPPPLSLNHQSFTPAAICLHQFSV